MSKGNMFINKAAGKVGNLVLYKRNGEQIMRAYQSKVKNPRTLEQVMQRAKFANAVKFFRRGQKNFFPFAYEDQRSNESAFNAFMRHNINLSPFLTKGMVDQAKFPAIGTWLLSQGSLNRPYSFISRGGNDPSGHPIDVLRLNLIDGMKLEKQTLGEFSKQLEMFGGFEEGDIFTFLFISSDAGDCSSVTLTELETDEDIALPGWCVCQFILDQSSTTPIVEWKHSGIPNFTMSVGTDGTYLEFSNGTTQIGMFAIAAVISRKTLNNKILTSESRLFGSVEWQKGCVGDVDELKNLRDIAKTWSSDNKAILKGSIANSK